ncbi:ankyrin repeat domain-containing protein [Gammaproteobacteria bacterium]|nr:ankyrin repeat domain-containing protein [Gammaproteobacteria bacterium]
MKVIKALKNPQSAIDPENLTRLGPDLFAVCTTEDEKLDKLIDFLKREQFDQRQISNLASTKSTLMIMPLQTICFLYTQSKSESQLEIKQRFLGKTFNACQAGAIENLIQLMRDIQCKDSLQGLLFQAKTHIIEQLAVAFLEETSSGRGTDFQTHDVTRLKWSINDQFNLDMHPGESNWFTDKQLGTKYVDRWLRYLDQHLSLDRLIEYCTQNINWDEGVVSQHPSIIVDDYQQHQTPHQANTLYVIGHHDKVVLKWYRSQKEQDEIVVSYRDLGFKKPVTLNPSMLKSFQFLENVLSLSMLHGLNLQPGRQNVQAYYQERLGIDENTFEQLEPLLFHHGYAERETCGELNKTLIVKAAASSQQLLEKDFFNQLTNKALPFSFEDRQVYRDIAEQYEQYSWYVMHLINIEKLSGEIEGIIQQNTHPKLRQYFAEERLLYDYWQGHLNQIDDACSNRISQLIKSDQLTLGEIIPGIFPMKESIMLDKLVTFGLSSEQLLHYAISSNDVKAVEHLIKKLDHTSFDSVNKALLLTACIKNKEMATLILSHHQPEIDSTLVLDWLTQLEDPEIMRQLIKNKKNLEKILTIHLKKNNMSDIQTCIVLLKTSNHSNQVSLMSTAVKCCLDHQHGLLNLILDDLTNEMIIDIAHPLSDPHTTIVLNHIANQLDERTVTAFMQKESIHQLMVEILIEQNNLPLMGVAIAEPTFSITALSEPIRKQLMQWTVTKGPDLYDQLIEKGLCVHETAQCQYTALHLAVQKEDLELVKKLVQTHQINVNATNQWGHTPLVTAIQGQIHQQPGEKSQKIIDFLLQQHPQLNDADQNCQPLRYAARAGNQNLCTKLIDQGAQPSLTAIIEATTYGYIDIVKLFITHDKTFLTSTLKTAINFKQVNIARLCIEQGTDLSQPDVKKSLIKICQHQDFFECILGVSSNHIDQISDPEVICALRHAAVQYLTQHADKQMSINQHQTIYANLNKIEKLPLSTWDQWFTFSRCDFSKKIQEFNLKQSNLNTPMDADRLKPKQKSAKFDTTTPGSTTAAKPTQRSG